MINWINEIAADDKEVIMNLINRAKEISEKCLELTVDDLAEEFGLQIEEGGFSDIFFYKNYAIKYTSFWDHDLDNEELRADLVLQSDGEVVTSLNQYGGFDSILPTIYAENANWVVMEKMEGPNLAELCEAQKTKEIPKEIEDVVLPYIERCIESGWYPLDLRMRCIYPNESTGLKVIDFNLYQTIAHLKEENADIDWDLTTEELAKELYFWETASYVG